MSAGICPHGGERAGGRVHSRPDRRCLRADRHNLPAIRRGNPCPFTAAPAYEAPPVSGERRSPTRSLEHTAMGKRDRRNSLKMTRLKAKEKKKIRERKPRAVRAELASANRKPKPAPAAPPPAADAAS